MKITKKLALLCMLACFFWLPPVQADEHAIVATTVMIHPKDGHEDQLIEAITAYHKWVAQFEGHFRYNWYEILTGPYTGKFVARSGGHTWADFDAEYDWQEEADKQFTETVAPHIENITRSMSEDMPEYSHWPESWDGYTHFHVQDWYVHNGHGAKFRRSLKKIVDTLKANNYDLYWGFQEVVSGGYGGHIRLVSANKGWGDFADAEPSFSDIMSEELGGEEELEAFMADWGSTFKAGKNWTVRRMPGASDYGDE